MKIADLLIVLNQFDPETRIELGIVDIKLPGGKVLDEYTDKDITTSYNPIEGILTLRGKG